MPAEGKWYAIAWKGRIMPGTSRSSEAELDAYIADIYGCRNGLKESGCQAVCFPAPDPEKVEEV